MTTKRSRCTPARFQTTSGCSSVVRKPWKRQEGPTPPPPPLSRAAATEVALGASAVEAVEDRKRDGEEKARKRRERAVLKAPRWNRNIVFGFEI